MTQKPIRVSTYTRFRVFSSCGWAIWKERRVLTYASFLYIYVQGRPDISTDDVTFIAQSCISRSSGGGVGNTCSGQEKKPCVQLLSSFRSCRREGMKVNKRQQSRELCTCSRASHPPGQQGGCCERHIPCAPSLHNTRVIWDGRLSGVAHEAATSPWLLREQNSELVRFYKNNEANLFLRLGHGHINPNVQETTKRATEIFPQKVPFRGHTTQDSAPFHVRALYWAFIP